MLKNTLFGSSCSSLSASPLLRLLRRHGLGYSSTTTFRSTLHNKLNNRIIKYFYNFDLTREEKQIELEDEADLYTFEYRYDLLKRFKGNVVTFSKASGSNAELSRFIVKCSEQEREMIIDEISNNVFELSLHPFAYVVIYRLLKKCDLFNVMKLVNLLFEQNELNNRFKKLAKSECGYRILEVLFERYGGEELSKYFDLTNETFFYLDRNAPSILNYILSSVDENVLLKWLKEIGEDDILKFCCNSPNTVSKMIKRGFLKVQQTIYENIKSNLFTLIKERNGSSVVDSLLNYYRNEDDIADIINKVLENVDEIVKTESGYLFVERNILQSLSVQHQDYFLEKLFRNGFLHLVTNEYGRRFITKLLFTLNQQKRLSIFALMVGHVEKLATNEVGSSFLSTCFKTYPEEIVTIVMNELQDKIIEISRNEYGSFIICRCTDFPYWRSIIIEKFRYRLLKEFNLCSRVINSLLKNASPEEKVGLFDEVYTVFFKSLDRPMEYAGLQSIRLLSTTLRAGSKQDIENFCKMAKGKFNIILTRCNTIIEVLFTLKEGILSTQLRQEIVKELIGDIYNNKPNFDNLRNMLQDTNGVKILEIIIKFFSLERRLLANIISLNTQAIKTTKFGDLFIRSIEFFEYKK